MTGTNPNNYILHSKQAPEKKDKELTPEEKILELLTKNAKETETDEIKDLSRRSLRSRRFAAKNRKQYSEYRREAELKDAKDAAKDKLDEILPTLGALQVNNPNPAVRDNAVEGSNSDLELVDDIKQSPSLYARKAELASQSIESSKLRDELDELKENGELDFLAEADLPSNDFLNAVVLSRAMRGIPQDNLFDGIAEYLNPSQKKAVFSKLKPILFGKKSKNIDKGAVLEYLAGKNSLGNSTNAAFGQTHIDLEAALVLKNS